MVTKLLRRIAVCRRVNAALKSFLLDARRASLERHYLREADRLHIPPGIGATDSSVRQRQARFGALPIPKPKGKLQILWVSANRAQDESGCLPALERFGRVTVVRQVYPSATRTDAQAAEDNAVALILAHMKMTHCDVILGQMWAQWMEVEKLMGVRARSTPICNVSMDDKLPDLWQKNRGAYGLSPACDVILTTDPNAVLWYAVEGCPATFWPPASDPNLFVGAPVRDIPISFIGTKYGVRETIITAIQQAGFPIQCWGDGWPNGPLEAKGVADVMGRSQIVLGIGTIGHSDHLTTLKLRDFDATMSGACYLTSYNPDLERCFIEGYDIEFYRSIPQLLTKLRYYLDHPEDQARVGRYARQSAMYAHTWDHRWDKALRLLGVLV